MLAALQPGWTVRLLQIFWPDPRPRLAFQEQVASWGGEGARGEGQELLSQGLLIHLQEAPLPFVRRTILEFALPGEAGLAWWEGLPGLLAAYGLQVRPLSAGGGGSAGAAGSSTRNWSRPPGTDCRMSLHLMNGSGWLPGTAGLV